MDHQTFTEPGCVTIIWPSRLELSAYSFWDDPAEGIYDLSDATAEGVEDAEGR